MKKIIISIVVILVLGVGGWYFFGSNIVNKEDGTGSDITEETKNYTGDIRKIVKLGIPLKCSWEYEDASGSSWVKGETIYSETKYEDRQVNSLIKDNCSRTWVEGENTGVLLCFDEDIFKEETENVEVPPPTATMKSLYEIDYKCSPAVLSGDKFNVPSNVEFKEIAPMIQGMEEIPSAESMEEMQGSLEDLQEQFEGMIPEGY